MVAAHFALQLARFLTLAACLIILMEIVFFLLDSESLVPVIEAWTGVICHHLPERTLRIGRVLPVCARCTGLYLGVLAGFALSVVLKPLSDAERGATTKIVLSSAVLLWAVVFIETLTEVVPFWDPGNLARVLFGLGLGLTPALVVGVGIRTFQSMLREV